MKYGVDFYDMFDGWIGMIDHPENQYDTLELAAIARDKSNKELNISNKNAGEHYGIFKVGGHVELDCPLDEAIKG